MKNIISLYVSDKKLKQFAKQGFYEIQKHGMTYQIHRKPEDMSIEKKIMKYKAKIKALQEKVSKIL